MDIAIEEDHFFSSQFDEKFPENHKKVTKENGPFRHESKFKVNHADNVPQIAQNLPPNGPFSRLFPPFAGNFSIFL